MQRWIGEKHAMGEEPEVDAFLSEIQAVCERHGMWLSHEDQHGRFEVVNESTADWLNAAADKRQVALRDCGEAGHDEGKCGNASCVRRA